MSFGASRGKVFLIPCVEGVVASPESLLVVGEVWAHSLRTHWAGMRWVGICEIGLSCHAWFGFGGKVRVDDVVDSSDEMVWGNFCPCLFK